MLMSLANEIKCHDTWFHAKQNAFYLWFKGNGKEFLEKSLVKHSKKKQDEESDGNRKFIVDDGDYAYLLVGLDGSVDKLSRAFKLSEENIDHERNEEAVATFTKVWEEPLDIVRFTPANSQYDFPLRANDDETLVDPMFLSAVGEVYDQYLEVIDPLFLAVVDDELKSYFEKRFQAISEEIGEEFNPENILMDLLISNLVKIILPIYYGFPWFEVDDEFQERKDAYLRFLHESFSVIKEQAFTKSREDMVTFVLGEGAESDITEDSESEAG